MAGNGIWFLQRRHKLLEWFSQAERQTGLETYEISVPSLPPAIVVNDPANVEHVFKKNEIFVKGDFFKARSWDLFGKSTLLNDIESGFGLEIVLLRMSSLSSLKYARQV